MSADVSIVIINYNTMAYTVKCLESIYKHSAGFSFEIVLVDNGSDSFDAATFAVKFPHIKIIENPGNLGFSKACNQGIASTSGEYVLLLNNDVELLENSILTCLDFLRSHTTIGVVSPRMVYPDGTPQHVANAFPSILNELIELFRLTKILPKKFLAQRLAGRHFDHQSSRETDWVWGTFFMFGRKWLDKLPGKKLNDAFFLYYEDVLWCYEFKEVGLSTFFLNTAKVVHHLSKSMEAGSYDKLGSMIENEKGFILKKKGPLYLGVYTLVKSLVYWTQKDANLRRLGWKFLKA